MDNFQSFFKTVGGNEGELCHWTTRLDTYGCGCAHDCAYCYAKSLLSFRGLWNPQAPKVVEVREAVKAVISKLKYGDVVRLGGMTDCFQPRELKEGVTKEIIRYLNARGIHYLIVTKSDLVASPDYMQVLHKKLAHIQISVTSTDAKLSKKIEPGAPIPNKRIKAVETLYDAGYDVSVRLSPYIPEFVDINIINSIRCDKILVEFLRVNAWIKKWLSEFDIDLSKHTLQSGGYNHLPLSEKKALLSRVNGFKEYTVCEDVPEHYNYWKENYNNNPDDCCNLRK